jgi:hypothetical protein
MRRRIQAEHVAPLYQAAFDRAASDRQLSPKEETDLKELAANLGITPRYDYPTEQLLDKFRLLWRIQNDTIPTVDSSIMLQRGEVCHYSAQADWHELRTRTVRSGYSGTLTSIRIAKGLSYRIGNYTPNCVTEDVLMMIDSGTVYVTNKRVIFDGGKKNTAIRHSAIIGITPYANGVGIEKATGKSPVLVLHGDAEIAATILCEAIARS